MSDKLVYDSQQKLLHYAAIHGDEILDLTPEQAYAHADFYKALVNHEHPDAESCANAARAVQFQTIGDCLMIVQREQDNVDRD